MDIFTIKQLQALKKCINGMNCTGCKAYDVCYPYSEYEVTNKLADTALQLYDSLNWLLKDHTITDLERAKKLIEKLKE